MKPLSHTHTPAQVRDQQTDTEPRHRVQTAPAAPSLHGDAVHALLGDFRVQRVAGAAVVLRVPVGVFGERAGAGRGPAPSAGLRRAVAEVGGGLEELAAEAVVAVQARRLPGVSVHVLLQLALVGEAQAAHGAGDLTFAGVEGGGGGGGAAGSAPPAPAQLGRQLRGQRLALPQRLLQAAGVQLLRGARRPLPRQVGRVQAGVQPGVEGVAEQVLPQALGRGAALAAARTQQRQRSLLQQQTLQEGRKLY